MMQRVAQRVERSYGEPSRLTDGYAALCIGVEAFMVLVAMCVLADAFAPGIAKMVVPSRLSALLWGAALSALAYVVFLPRSRYQKWADAFSEKTPMVRSNPVAVEVGMHFAVFLLLILSVFIHWWMRRT